MKDRVPLYPGRVKLVPVSGQSNVYDMVRADQPTQAGDPLNKATLLKDATAALFGLGADSVPDDVLQKLAGAAFDSGGTITDVNGNPLGVRIATGSYVGTGTYGESSPNSLTFEFDARILIISAYTNSSGYSYSTDFFVPNILKIQSGRSIEWHDGADEYELHSINFSGRKIDWYSSESAIAQLNESGYEYFYTVLS